MATADDDAAWMDSFLAELAEAPAEHFPDWEDASDLARLHVQEFARGQVGGFELSRSRGSLRLTGPGVRGHALNLVDAGLILASFQTLVTSAGASKQGVTNPRGRVPAEVVARTRLLLNASPQPGSVVLDFEPASNEAQERYPGGQAPLEEITPLIEDSIDIAFEVLKLASSPEVDVLAEERFPEWGPRVASAARELAEVASKAGLDINAAWERPSAGRQRVRVTSSQLAQLREILQRRGLDSRDEVLEGILRTVSDRRKIELEVRGWASPDDEADSGTESDAVIDDQVRVVAINRGEVNFTGFGLGDRVTMDVRVRLLHRPGAADTSEYTALSIQRAISDPAEKSP